jgi:hypothetical protein
LNPEKREESVASALQRRAEPALFMHACPQHHKANNSPRHTQPQHAVSRAENGVHLTQSRTAEMAPAGSPGAGSSRLQKLLALLDSESEAPCQLVRATGVALSGAVTGWILPAVPRSWLDGGGAQAGCQAADGHHQIPPRAAVLDDHQGAARHSATVRCGRSPLALLPAHFPPGV